MTNMRSETRKVQTRFARGYIFAALLTGILLCIGIYPLLHESTTLSTKPDDESVNASYMKLPLSFEKNRGQAGPAYDYLARGGGYKIGVSSTKVNLNLTRTSSADQPKSGQSASITIHLAGANENAPAVGEQPLEGKINYLVGNDPAAWQTDIPTVGKVGYNDVYPGIGVAYYGNQSRLEYDFVAAPYADIRRIALEFTGVERVEIEPASGDLILHTGGESLRQHAPVSYQEFDGERHIV